MMEATSDTKPARIFSKKMKKVLRHQMQTSKGPTTRN